MCALQFSRFILLHGYIRRFVIKTTRKKSIEIYCVVESLPVFIYFSTYLYVVTFPTQSLVSIRPTDSRCMHLLNNRSVVPIKQLEPNVSAKCTTQISCRLPNFCAVVEVKRWRSVSVASENDVATCFIFLSV